MTASAEAVAKQLGLGQETVRRNKGVRTTISATDGTRAGDLLARNFNAPARAEL